MKKQFFVTASLLGLSLALLISLGSWKDKRGHEGGKPAGFKKPAAGYELKKRMEQRAIITAWVLKDPQLRSLYMNAVKMKLAANDQHDESVSFDEICTGAEKYAAEFAPAFRRAYLALLQEGNYPRAESFKGIPAGDPSGRISEKLMTEANADFFYNDGAQIYFPYSERFDPGTADAVTVTYHPLEEVDANEGFRVLGEKETIMETIVVDEQHAETNPTLVINFNEEEGENNSVNDPPPPVYSCSFLQYNTYSDVLDDRYVISVTMPKIKLLRNFRSFIGGANYITLYQCFARPNNMNINPTPALDPITAASRIVCHEYKVRRNKVGQWIDFGQVFNDDWRMIQYENPVLLWVKRGWFLNPSGAVDLKIQGGVKLDTIRIRRPGQADSFVYRWINSFNAGAGVNLHLDIGHKYQYIGSDYVTRRGMLANCVGDNFGNGTANDAGDPVPWTVRKLSDAMLFYFKVRECHKE